MAFTLTSQSVIRFESSTAPLGDEWQRTLMFFNVDISAGGVHCDHRNQITAPRTQDRNGKHTFPGRNPGGGLSNSIMESAMPFGQQNEFYAQGRDDFDHRGSRPRRRSPGGRRKNDSSRSYRSTKPRGHHPDAAPFSHCPTKSSPHRYVTPDYETANGYDEVYSNRSAPKSYLPKQISRNLTYTEVPRDSRDDTGYYTDSSYEIPPNYYPNERPKRGSYQRSNETPPYRNCSPYYPEELSCHDFNTNGWESLSQLNMFRPRGKQRQASGSILPEYPLNSNDVYHHKEYKNEGSYDRYKEPKVSNYEDRYEDSQPPPAFGHKVRYSPLKRFGYENYGENRLRSTRLPSPNSKAKIRNEGRTPYRAYRDVGFPISQSRNHKAESDRFRNTDMPDKLSRQSHEPGSRHGVRSKEPERRHRSRSKESGSCRRNRSRRHSHLAKVPYAMTFKEAREASTQCNRISKQIALPKMHVNNPKANAKVPRKTPEKRKFNFMVDNIPHPLKKYINKEAPFSNFHLDIDDEIPRHQRKLIREASVTLSSKMKEKHERKTYPKPDKNKLFDFGSEIPYKLWKNAAPCPMLFGFDIPFKKQDRSKDLKSYTDSDCYAVPSSSAKLKREQFKKSNLPQVSLYDLKTQPSAKTITQKISGFLKMSKKFHTRSSKKKIVNNQDNEKVRPASTLPKSRIRSGSQESKKKSTCGQKAKESILTEPSLNHKRCLSKIGTGSHYPTVFRGKSPNEENKEYSTCNNFCLSRCPKSDHSDRISSGNCSLNNVVMENEPITMNLSEDSLIGRLKIVESKTTFSLGSSNSCSCSGSESSCLSLSIQACLPKENEFKNVRFTPTPSIICQCPSSTSSSSQNSCDQGIIYSRSTLINPHGIEVCCKSTCTDLGCDCPRQRTCPKWSLTQKSNPYNLDCTCTCRPARLGLCLPSNIEMTSRPPTMVPFESCKKSSLKCPNNRLGRTSNRRVCLQVSRSNSSQSRSSSGKCTINSDENSYCSGKGIIIRDETFCSSEENIPIPVCEAARKLEKLMCQKSQYNIGKYLSKSRCSCISGNCMCQKSQYNIGKYESKTKSSCISGKCIKTNDKSSGTRTNSGFSLCCNAKSEAYNIEANSKEIQCNIGDLCDERKLKLEVISENSIKSIKIIDTTPGSSENNPKMCEISSCCDAKEEVDNMEEKPGCQCIQCIMNNMGVEQKSCSCSLPQENPSCPPPIVSSESYCVPQFPKNCSCSTITVCSRDLSQSNLKCSPEATQLISLPNCTCPPCFPKSLAPLPYDVFSEPIPGETLISNWSQPESTCGKSIVEELKRELLNSFRRESDIQYPLPSYRNASHFMVFPCQTPRIINRNQFYGPDSVVRWAACSKPRGPF